MRKRTAGLQPDGEPPPKRAHTDAAEIDAAAGQHVTDLVRVDDAHHTVDETAHRADVKRAWDAWTWTRDRCLSVAEQSVGATIGCLMPDLCGVIYEYMGCPFKVEVVWERLAYPQKGPERRRRSPVHTMARAMVKVTSMVPPATALLHTVLYLFVLGRPWSMTPQTRNLSVRTFVRGIHFLADNRPTAMVAVVAPDSSNQALLEPTICTPKHAEALAIELTELGAIAPRMVNGGSGDDVRSALRLIEGMPSGKCDLCHVILSPQINCERTVELYEAATIRRLGIAMISSLSDTLMVHELFPATDPECPTLAYSFEDSLAAEKIMEGAIAQSLNAVASKLTIMTGDHTRIGLTGEISVVVGHRTLVTAQYNSQNCVCVDRTGTGHRARNPTLHHNPDGVFFDGDDDAYLSSPSTPGNDTSQSSSDESSDDDDDSLSHAQSKLPHQISTASSSSSSSSRSQSSMAASAMKATDALHGCLAATVRLQYVDWLDGVQLRTDEFRLTIPVSEHKDKYVLSPTFVRAALFQKVLAACQSGSVVNMRRCVLLVEKHRHQQLVNDFVADRLVARLKSRWRDAKRSKPLSASP